MITERVWEAVLFVNRKWKELEELKGIKFPLPTTKPTNRLERALQQRNIPKFYFYYISPEQFQEYWKKLMGDLGKNTDSTG